MPFFLFVSFANEIKRIRDKTFCFDIQLKPNHDIHHTYMGRGATQESCVEFLCLKSHLCCSGNKQQHVCYPRTCFATYKQIASDSLSQSHLKRKRKQTRELFKLTQQTIKGYSLCGVHSWLFP